MGGIVAIGRLYLITYYLLLTLSVHPLVARSISALPSDHLQRMAHSSSGTFPNCWPKTKSAKARTLTAGMTTTTMMTGVTRMTARSTKATWAGETTMATAQQRLQRAPFLTTPSSYRLGVFTNSHCLT